MPCGSPVHQQKSFRIKHDDDKFFTRLLSKEKESSKSNPSFRVYYGDVSSAIPFVWETQPGTSKFTISSCDTTFADLPPLTPPPSYHANNIINNLNASSSSSSSNYKQYSKSKLLINALLRRMSPKIVHLPSSPSNSSSSSSAQSHVSWPSYNSSHSWFSDPMMTPKPVHKRRRFSSWGSSNFDHERVMADMDEGMQDGELCANSRLCFGIGKDNINGVVKKALSSIVGRGSA